MNSQPSQNGKRDFILRVNSCLTPTEVIHNASILCQNGMVQAVGGYSALRVLEDIPCIDRRDCRAIPGLVDTHIHGSGGFAAMDAAGNPNLAALSSVLARHGVTSFVLTALSAAPDKLVPVVRALADAHEQDFPGAVPLGIHLEGPFLSPEKSGAQDSQHIRPVDLAEAKSLVEAGKGRVKIMTFAPELPGSSELIRFLLDHGIIPSMGHSMAEEDDVLKAIASGATRCTHLFNGMPALDQRKAGLTSVGLTDDRLTIELIVDGFHVHPRMIDLACRVKGASGVVGISDATQGAGMPEGEYHYGERRVRIKDGQCRLVSDNRLAGSALTLDQAMQNLARFSSLDEPQMVACFTKNAAASVGHPERGVIQPGKRADIAVVDENLNIRMTIVGGRVVYDAMDDA